MKKVILLDADGVVLKKGPEYFSERFCREYGGPVDEVRAFFKNEFRQCQVGKADLIQELDKRLPGWGWDKSTQEYLRYWFANDVVLDKEVLKVAKEIQGKGIECYLTTDQEIYRSEYLAVQLFGKLNGAWFSCDLGVPKSDPEFFKEIIRRWEGRYKPEEIWYWDDEQSNVDAARAAGINAYLYTSLDDLKRGVEL